VSGWFVTTVAETPWWWYGEFGASCNFEAEDDRLDQYGINIQVLWPGQPNAMYHGEAAQDGPCAILMVGARGDEVDDLIYPVSEVAGKHGASVEPETKDPHEAYPRFEPKEAPLPGLGFPWQ
jgi:hypothetical protein